MIKKLLSIGFAVISISAFAQSTATTNVPVQVSNAFHAQYPAVTNPTWNIEGGYYEPVFTLNGIENIGYIDLKGHFIQTIAKIKVVDLPAPAAIHISQVYPGGQISDAGRIDFTNNTPSRYYATVSGKQLLFTNTGTFIRITESVLKQ